MIGVYNKKYIEEWAKCLLAVVYECDISTLEHRDKPDLQDDVNSIGIEVVEDCFPIEKKHERFISKILDVPFDQVSPKELEGFYREGGTVTVKDNKLERASLGGFGPIPNTQEYLIKTIKKKIQKLNSGGYRLFQSNRLYVRTETISVFLDAFADDIIEAVSSISCEHKFDVIYLEHYFELITCNFNTNCYSRKIITHETGNKIRQLMNGDSRMGE